MIMFFSFNNVLRNRVTDDKPMVYLRVYFIILSNAKYVSASKDKGLSEQD